MHGGQPNREIKMISSEPGQPKLAKVDQIIADAEPDYRPYLEAVMRDAARTIPDTATDDQRQRALVWPMLLAFHGLEG